MAIPSSNLLQPATIWINPTTTIFIIPAMAMIKRCLKCKIVEDMYSAMITTPLRLKCKTVDATADEMARGAAFHQVHMQIVSSPVVLYVHPSLHLSMKKVHSSSKRTPWIPIRALYCRIPSIVLTYFLLKILM